MRLALLLLALPVLGCAGSLNQAQREGIAARRGVALGAVGVAPSERCEALDRQRRDWGAVAAGGLVLTGASGLSALPVEHLPERYRGPAHYGAATSAVLAAAVTAYALHQETGLAEAWAQECQR